jgi:hypothetical protein
MGHHPRDHRGGGRTEDVDSPAGRGFLLDRGDQFLRFVQGSKKIFDIDVSDSRLLPFYAHDRIQTVGVADLNPSEDALAYPCRCLVADDQVRPEALHLRVKVGQVRGFDLDAWASLLYNEREYLLVHCGGYGNEHSHTAFISILRM